MADVETLATYDSLIAIGFLASLLAGVATGLGAFPVFAAARISIRLRDVTLGFAAGVMLAASAFSLIVPGLEVADEGYGSELAGAAGAACSMASVQDTQAPMV